MTLRDAVDLVGLLYDLRVEGGHDELAGVPLVRRLRQPCQAVSCAECWMLGRWRD